jgi:choline-glycine betaine transporter
VGTISCCEAYGRPALERRACHAITRGFSDCRRLLARSRDCRLGQSLSICSIEEAVYFSFVTFTTLGYGDITLSEGFRVLSGIQALNGIILVGWSTAMIFSVVQHVWRGLTNNVASDD